MKTCRLPARIQNRIVHEARTIQIMSNFVIAAYIFNCILIKFSYKCVYFESIPFPLSLLFPFCVFFDVRVDVVGIRPIRPHEILSQSFIDTRAFGQEKARSTPAFSWALVTSFRDGRIAPALCFHWQVSTTANELTTIWNALSVNTLRRVFSLPPAKPLTYCYRRLHLYLETRVKSLPKWVMALRRMCMRNFVLYIYIRMAMHTYGRE